MKSLILVLGLLFSLAQAQTRNLLEDVKFAQSRLSEIQGQPEALQAQFNETYQFLLALDPQSYDIKQVRAQTSEILRTLFQIREQLRDHVDDWKKQGILSAEFENGLRRMMRSSHYLSDIVSEISMDNQKLAKGQIARQAFTGGMPWTVGTDERPLNAADFKAGDMLIMRGGSPVSASIARITDMDSIFSHVAIIHVDEKSGKKYVVEALIEKGATINTLEQALHHGVGRMTLVRPVDAELGRKAAQAIYNVVRATQIAKKPMVYDFTMSAKLPDTVTLQDLNRLAFELPIGDYENLSAQEKAKTLEAINVVLAKLKGFNVFCSGLLDLGFHIGSGGQLQLPYLKSRMTPTNRAFLQRLGIPDTTTLMYAPGDTEYESRERFTVVSEFREPMKTASLRMDDLIFDKIFYWMEKGNLTFNETKLLGLIGATANGVSHIGFMKRFLQARGFAVAPHVSGTVISTVLMLQKMHDAIKADLIPRMNDYEKKTGYPMPPRLVYKAIDEIYEAKPEVIKFLKTREPQSVSGSACREAARAK